MFFYNHGTVVQLVGIQQKPQSSVKIIVLKPEDNSLLCKKYDI